MKKFILLLSSFILISFGTFSQDAITIKKGEQFYEHYNYFQTIEKLEPLPNKKRDIKKKLAYSYYNTNQYDWSEKYFSEIIADDDKDLDDIYSYVKTLLINQKYDEAEVWMKKFLNYAPNDKRAGLFASNMGFYKKLDKDKGYFSIKNLDFNNKSQEFSPVFYGKNRVVFSSSRSFRNPIKRIWTWNKMPFLNLLVADIDSATLELKNIKSFKFNKKYHEGTVAFNKAMDYMIFTSDNYKNTSADDVTKLVMFESRLKNGKWQKPTAFKYNSPEFSVGHPTLSPSGDSLYFSSDMPGGVGGVDLYMCVRTQDSSWSKPINLGPKINTEGNEMFPFIHKKGFLFFASDGRPGLGGLDLFVTKIEDNNFEDITNLGAPVNTNFDDFALVFDETMTNGYFCSNRFSGKGNDDIYSFKLLVPFFDKTLLRGITVSEKDKILANVMVTLFDGNNVVIDSVRSDSLGKFEFKLDKNKNYTVEGIKPNFKNGINTVSTFGSSSIYETKLVLVEEPSFNIAGLVYDDKTKQPIDSVRVILTDKTNNKIFAKTTNSNGKFFCKLDLIKLNDEITYHIEVNKDGYMPFARDFKIKYTHAGTYNIEDYLKIDLIKIDIGIDIAKSLDINPIYFDLNKSNIRPDAAIELDKIVKFMNEHPKVEIELGSHTDSRGSAYSNRALSTRRAKSSANYIKKRITNPSRIYGKGYGESRFFTVDKATHAQYDFLPEGQLLSEKFIFSLSKSQKKTAHQLNRRTEFKVVKY